MNTRILDLIKNPEILKAEDLSILAPEIERLPYMQSLRAIYLLGIHQFRNEDFQQELTKTAAYTTDKKILYHFINQSKKSEVKQEITPIKTTEKETIIPKIEEKSTEEKVENQTTVGIDFYTRNPSKSEREVASLEQKQQNFVTPQYESQSSIMDYYSKPKQLKNNHLENNIITDNQPIDFYQKPIAVEEKQEVVEEEPTWIPMNIEQNPIPAPQPIVEEEEEIIVEEEEFIPAEEESISIEETTEPIEIEEEEEKPIIPQSNVPQFINTWQNWLNATPPPSERDKKLAIIDKFIENNPKISPAKEDVEFVVKEKSDDISHLMTETLASLYLEQKLYSKAINAYKILQEKYPERTEDFEEKIQEIKKSRK